MDSKNFLIPAAIIAAGAIVAIAILYAGRAQPPADKTAGGPATPSIVPTPASLEDGDDPALGSPEAPVTMVEFSDFECPFCGRFWRDTLPQLEVRYIRTGKVRFVYRDFPISAIHASAAKAAEAGACAHEQGKFWPYHDRLFQQQDALGIPNFKRWAAELGLDGVRFNECLDAGRYAGEVAKDYADGQAAGVNGTPTFFVNGRQVVGAVPLEQLAGVIDQALAGR